MSAPPSPAPSPNDPSGENRLLQRLKAAGVGDEDAKYALSAARKSDQQKIATLSQQLKDMTRQVNLLCTRESTSPGTVAAQPVYSQGQVDTVLERLIDNRDQISDAKAALTRALENIEGEANKEDFSELGSSLAAMSNTAKSIVWILCIGMGVLVPSMMILIALFIWQTTG